MENENIVQVIDKRIYDEQVSEAYKIKEHYEKRLIHLRNSLLTAIECLEKIRDSNLGDIMIRHKEDGYGYAIRMADETLAKIKKKRG